MRLRISRKLRRAMSTVEMGVALGLIAVVVAIGGYTLSTNTSADLDQTATEVADPSKLVDRFLPSS